METLKMDEIRILKTNHLFDFDQSINFVQGFPLSKSYSAKKCLLNSIQIDGYNLLFQVTQNTENSLKLEICNSNQKLPNEIFDKLERRIRLYLSLDDDLTQFYTLADSDPVFSEIRDLLYGYHQVKFLTPFEAACWAILSARNTIPVAMKLKRSLCVDLGLTLKYNNREFLSFPEPVTLLDISDQRLAKILRSDKKAGYLMNVAEFFYETSEVELLDIPSKLLIDRLKAINGIGSWSAELIAIRGLGIMDILENPESRLLKAFKNHYSKNAEIKTILEYYGDFKAYWAHYLRVCDLLYSSYLEKSHKTHHENTQITKKNLCCF